VYAVAIVIQLLVDREWYSLF